MTACIQSKQPRKYQIPLYDLVVIVALVYAEQGNIIAEADVARDDDRFTLTWTPTTVGTFCLELWLDDKLVEGLFNHLSPYPFLNTPLGSKVVFDALPNLTANVIGNTPFSNGKTTFTFEIKGATPTEYVTHLSTLISH